MNKIKDIGWAGLGLIIMVFLFVLIVFFVKGGVWIFVNFYGFIQVIDRWVFAIIALLLVLSVIPKFRLFTGFGIYYLTYIWGAFFWLFCLFITYEYWGLFGIFIGIILAGIGVFLTSFLAILLDGQFFDAFMIVLNLILIYTIRSLGYWIASKYKNKDIPESSNISIIN